MADESHFVMRMSDWRDGWRPEDTDGMVEIARAMEEVVKAARAYADHGVYRDSLVEALQNLDEVLKK